MKKIFTIILILLFSNYLQAQVPGAYLAYWSFNDTLADASANHFDLTNVATVNTFVPGVKGNAIHTGGGYLYHQNFPPILGSFSISTFGKNKSLSPSFGYPTFIEIAQSVLLRYSGSFNNLEGSLAYSYMSTTQFSSIFGVCNADTNWHHYAVSYNASIASAQLYVDGKIVATQTNNLNINPIGLNAAYPLMIGGGSGGTVINQQKIFDGYIDEMYVYQGTSLDSNGIRLLYCDGYLTPPTFSISGNTLTLNAGNKDSVQWYKNGVAISGAISNTYTITASDVYSVKVFAVWGCSKSSASQSVTLSTGINELNAIKFDVAPNPTTNYITINSAVLNAQVNIYAIDGRNIFEDKIIGSKKNIDVSGFENGLYIIELKADGKISRTKFIKE
jgi:hypothetical protein